MRPSSILTLLICLAAVLVTWGIFILVGYNYNGGNWLGTIIFSSWDSAVYLALGVVAIIYKDSIFAARCFLIGAVLITAFSLAMLHKSQHLYYMPPGPFGGPMNCVGPVIELGLPLLQWSCFFVFTVITAMIHRWKDLPQRNLSTNRCQADSSKA